MAGNSENFTLQDFIQIEGATLDERVTPFSDTLDQYTREGRTLYAREIIGAPGPWVQMVDSLTGQTRRMLMMGSNDYLGLTHHPRVKKRVQETIETFGVGMGGPPLLNGMSSLHRRLERELAELKHAEDALIYASGFQANLGWTHALLRTGDVVLYDELNHASFFDGLAMVRATRRVRAFSFSHNNVKELAELLEKHRDKKDASNSKAHIFVLVEGVYSMDGDLAPLPEITRLCREFGATLIVDDAHGTGVLGENGGGAAKHFGVAEQVPLSMGTFSKSFGVTGGFIAGPRKVIQYLRFFSRSYVFSAHLPQSSVAAVLAGLEVMREEPGLRRKLHENVRYLLSGLRTLGIPVATDSAIIPVMTPPSVNLRALSRGFHEGGLFVNAIEYPAVSLQEQRIRLSLMAPHERADLDFALGLFEKLGRQHGLFT